MAFNVEEMLLSYTNKKKNISLPMGGDFTFPRSVASLPQLWHTPLINPGCTTVIGRGTSAHSPSSPLIWSKQKFKRRMYRGLVLRHFTVIIQNSPLVLMAYKMSKKCNFYILHRIFKRSLYRGRGRPHQSPRSSRYRSLVLVPH